MTERQPLECQSIKHESFVLTKAAGVNLLRMKVVTRGTIPRPLMGRGFFMQ